MNTSRLLVEVAKVMNTQESVLVALSGGADSVALLAALVELGHRCVAFHCNYGLRGEESNRDERHAIETASRLGVPIEVIHCEVATYRLAHPGTSVEMACREMRYKAFDKAMAKHKLDSIAVGHHLEDNIETLMLNMLRGSGIKGLAAMKPRRGNIVRPLLNCTKEEILSYLSARGLSYVTDSSNLSCDYRRNALRNEILPLIKKYFPDCDGGFIKTLTALDSQRTLLDATINGYTNEFVSTDGIINLKGVIDSNHPVKEVLFEILNYPDYKGFNTTIIDNIIDSSHKSGLLFSGNNSTYLLDHGLLIPTQQDSDATDVSKLALSEILTENSFFSGELISRDEFRPTRDNKIAYFDYDALSKCKDLVVRNPRNGDRIQPWGMKGSKLLSDIFTDLHYSIPARRKALVLEADGKVLWLIGIRASRHFAVTPETTSILRLTVNDQLTI